MLSLGRLLAGCGGDPAEAERQATRAVSRLEEGDPAEAERLARSAAAAAPGSALAAEALGRALLGLGQAESAVAELRRAVHLGDQPRRRGLLAQALLAAGKLDLAADAIEGALAQAPQEPALVRLAVLVYPRVGRLDEALALARTALELEPGHPPTMVRVASCWIRAGRKDEARTLLDTLDPARLENVDDLALLGGCRYDLDDAPRAVAALEAAASRDPGSAELQFNLGSAYLVAERFPAAKAAFEKVLAVTPGDAKTMGQIAFCLIRMGRKESARQMLEAARQKDPGDPVLKAMEGELGVVDGEP